MLIYQIIFLVVFFLFSVFAFYFFISVFTGAPYVPTSYKRVKKMIALAQIKKGTRVVDLGSGDGRLVIEAAKMGANACGVEINPGLWLFSIVNSLWQKRYYRGRANFRLMSLYNVDFRDYDVIFFAGFVEMVKILERKFEKGLNKGTKVICYAFPLPNRKPDYSRDGVYMYIYL